MLRECVCQSYGPSCHPSTSRPDPWDTASDTQRGWDQTSVQASRDSAKKTYSRRSSPAGSGPIYRCFGKWCGRPWLLAKPARARLHAGACGDRRKHSSSPPSTSRHSAGPASRLPTFESEDVLIAAQEPLATSNLFDQRGHDRLPIQTSPMQFLNTVQNLGNMERLAGSAEYVLHHI